MSLDTNLKSALTQIATDWKNEQTKTGALASLNTTSKVSLVAAINELKAALAGAGVTINDVGTSGASVWSSSKTNSEVAAQVAAAVTGLKDSAPAALDTLKELATALGDDANFATTITAALGNRVRFDAAQTLTAPQKAQALANIGGAAQSAVDTLNTNLGTITSDYLAVYVAAKV